MFLQAFDARQDAGVLQQHVVRYIRQGDFASQNVSLDRAFKYFRQALHLRFGQRIACAHAVADIEVFDEVGREIHLLAVRVAHIRQRTDAALHIARVGVVEMRRTQFAIGVVNAQAVRVKDFCRQCVFAAWLEPALIRVMHKGCLGNVFAPELAAIKMVAIQSLNKFSQGRCQCTFLGGSLAIGKAHRRIGIPNMERPYVGNDVAPRCNLNFHAQVCQDF